MFTLLQQATSLTRRQVLKKPTQDSCSEHRAFSHTSLTVTTPRTRSKACQQKRGGGWQNPGAEPLGPAGTQGQPHSPPSLSQEPGSRSEPPTAPAETAPAAEQGPEAAAPKPPGTPKPRRPRQAPHASPPPCPAGPRPAPPRGAVRGQKGRGAAARPHRGGRRRPSARTLSALSMAPAGLGGGSTEGGGGSEPPPPWCSLLPPSPPPQRAPPRSRTRPGRRWPRSRLSREPRPAAPRPRAGTGAEGRGREKKGRERGRRRGDGEGSAGTEAGRAQAAPKALFLLRAEGGEEGGVLEIKIYKKVILSVI